MNKIIVSAIIKNFAKMCESLNTYLLVRLSLPKFD